MPDSISLLFYHYDIPRPCPNARCELHPSISCPLPLQRCLPRRHASRRHFGHPPTQQLDSEPTDFLLPQLGVCRLFAAERTVDCISQCRCQKPLSSLPATNAHSFLASPPHRTAIHPYIHLSTHPRNRKRKEKRKTHAHPAGVVTPSAQSSPALGTTWSGLTGVMTTPALASDTQKASAVARSMEVFILKLGVQIVARKSCR